MLYTKNCCLVRLLGLMEKEERSMKFRNIILAITLVIASFATCYAQAQPDLNFHFGFNNNGVITAKPFPCGPFTGTQVGTTFVPDYYCDGIPVWYVNQFGVIINTNIWLDVNHHGQYDFIGFLNETENLGIAQVTNVVSTGNAVIASIAGPMAGYVPNPSLPSPPYTGTVTFIFTQYRGCTTGRYAHCGQYWNVTGLSGLVNYTPQTSAQPADVQFAPLANLNRSPIRRLTGGWKFPTPVL
jgi:hypothetical protein